MTPFTYQVYKELGRSDKVTANLAVFLRKTTDLTLDEIVELLGDLPLGEITNELQEQIELISHGFFVNPLESANICDYFSSDENFHLEGWNDNGTFRMCLYLLKSHVVVYKNDPESLCAYYKLSDLLKSKDRLILYDRFNILKKQITRIIP